MKSMQSIVWNLLQDGMESSRRKCTFGDAMRLRRYHTRLRVIPYQACGLDKKTTSRNLSFFLAGAIGIEPTLRESEARVLPLHQAPPMWTLYSFFS